MITVTLLNPDDVKVLYEKHGQIACVCYDTPEKHAERVGISCQRSGHMSGSRCEYIKFRITGLDRGTAEQCMRHEIGTDVPYAFQDNYSFQDAMDTVTSIPADQVVKNCASFRYIDKSGFEWETPATIRRNASALAEYEALMKHINERRSVIKQLLEDGGCTAKQATQDANFVLPRATTSELVMGFTPEALIHFCHKRMCVRAQEFIREIAFKMQAAIADVSPRFASELMPQCEHLMWCPEQHGSCKRYPTKQELQKILQNGGDTDGYQRKKTQADCLENARGEPGKASSERS